MSLFTENKPLGWCPWDGPYLSMEERARRRKLRIAKWTATRRARLADIPRKNIKWTPGMIRMIEIHYPVGGVAPVKAALRYTCKKLTGDAVHAAARYYHISPGDWGERARISNDGKRRLAGPVGNCPVRTPHAGKYCRHCRTNWARLERMKMGPHQVQTRIEHVPSPDEIRERAAAIRALRDEVLNF